VALIFDEGYETKHQDRARTLWRRYGSRLALSVLLLVMTVVAVLYLRVDTRAREDHARPADAIIVLGAAVWANERPSPALNARVQHAITLYRQGLAPHLILCGGVGKNQPSEAEVMRRLAVSAGIPADALVLEERSRSTEESLSNARALMAARGWQTAIIVSDPFHLYRAELIARHLGLEAYGSGAHSSPTYAHTLLRMRYTIREALAVVWYYATRLVELDWLYGMLKGKI